MTHSTRLIALVLAAAPGLALAAGSSSSNPPTKTETTNVCEQGFMYDAETKTCVAIQQDSMLDQGQAYDLVRELAYAGRYGDAQLILSGMDQSDDGVMTYWGFTHRKMGNTDAAMAAYYNALAVNPDNILARSYMGQAYVDMGAVELAQLQLTEIKARGGRETWAAKSLGWAIENGQTLTY